jgi:hypothetical protein
MATQRPSIGRLILHGIIAFLLAIVLLVVALYSIISQEPNRPEPLQYDIPSEISCLIAASMHEDMPERIVSDKPHLRLRKTSENSFELLYWGKPIRPQYAYSITRLSNRKSVLRNSEGEQEASRSLPVTNQCETQGEIPLQPSILLKGIEGKPGEYYAARICIHDAADNTILHSAIYLICGDTL